MSDEDILDLEMRYLFIESQWRSRYADNEKQLKAVIAMREALDRKKQSSTEVYQASLKDVVEYMEVCDYYKENGGIN